MIRTVFLFVLLLASVGLGITLRHDAGYVLIAVNHWTIETTLWIAIPGLILAFILLHFFISICQKIINIPLLWRDWRHLRRTKKAQAKTRQGLIEFSEGHWLLAKNHLIKALPDTDAPLLNYLTAARAAQELGDNQLRDDYLREAQQSMPEAKIAVELTQAQLQLANQQWEQALATLKHLQDLAPRHPYVLKLLMHLYEEMEDWPQLIALMPSLKRYRILSDNAFNCMQQRVYLNQMKALVQQNQTILIEALAVSLPKKLADDPALMATYCSYLLNQQEDVKAESILRRCLQKQIQRHPERSEGSPQFNTVLQSRDTALRSGLRDLTLIDLYGRLKADSTRLKFAELLLKKHPHSASLYLCLGRLCVSKQLWGKAKTYFEESIKLNATASAYAEYGHLLELLNDTTAACEAYRKGLRLL